MQKMNASKTRPVPGSDKDNHRGAENIKTEPNRTEQMETTIDKCSNELIWLQERINGTVRLLESFYHDMILDPDIELRGTAKHADILGEPYIIILDMLRNINGNIQAISEKLQAATFTKPAALSDKEV